MNQIEQVPPDPRMVKLVYGLYLLSMFFGPVALAGLAIAYEQKKSAPDWVASHYRFQIRTFWISMLFVLVIAFPAFFILGTAVMGLTSPSGLVLGLCGVAVIGVLLWWIIRCLRGLRLASKDQAILNPASWAFGE